MCYYRFMEFGNNNLILMNKPKGISSFDVIRQLRKKLGIRKIGHAGTLDPRASGLLLIGVGEGTKKIKDLIGLPKVYIAEILLGIKTDTGDFDPKYPNGEGLGGKIIEEKKLESFTKEKVEKVLKSLIGDVVLEVSLYSAMKRRGKPLYKYAREGKKITKPKRVMTIYRADLKKIDILDKEKNMFGEILVTVEFEVGSGTYIRSIAEELGERMGSVATLRNLRRISIGDYKLKDAEEFLN